MKRGDIVSGFGMLPSGLTEFNRNQIQRLLYLFFVDESFFKGRVSKSKETPTLELKKSVLQNSCVVFSLGK